MNVVILDNGRWLCMASSLLRDSDRPQSLSAPGSLYNGDQGEQLRQAVAEQVC